MKVIPYDKLARAFRIIKQEGGIFRALCKLAKIDTLKEGNLVGVDFLGNRYFENNYYMVPRNRWVEYCANVHWDYDASQVPAEWYGWLHHKTDSLPWEDKAKYTLNNSGWSQTWLLPHEENRTATERAYYPYRTTPQPMQVWDGKSLPKANEGCASAPKQSGK